MIFDTHAHYTSRAFEQNRTELLDSLPQQGVCAVVDCAVDLDSAERSLALGEQYPWLYTAVGIHPESLIEADVSTALRFGGDWRAELAAMEPLYAHPRVVAVGECGLDHHWPVPRDAQAALFEAQLELAKAHNLPVLMHDREAHAEMYALLKKHKPRGILHCYSGSADDAQWITAQGLYIGVGGVVTFPSARKLRETVERIPLTSLVLETDCPYMAPVPFRGKQCHSGMISYVAQAIAEIQGESAETVLAVTEQNARTLFSLPDA